MVKHKARTKKCYTQARGLLNSILSIILKFQIHFTRLQSQSETTILQFRGCYRNRSVNSKSSQIHKLIYLEIQIDPLWTHDLYKNHTEYYCKNSTAADHRTHAEVAGLIPCHMPQMHKLSRKLPQSQSLHTWHTQTYKHASFLQKHLQDQCGS